MTDVIIQNASRQADSSPDNFDIHDAKELKKILTRFVKEYSKKPETQSDEEWLTERFLGEIPNMSKEEAEALSRETVASVHEFNQNLTSVHTARSEGKVAEEWFVETSLKAATNMPVNELVQDMYTLELALESANDFMHEVVTTQSGAIDHNLSLHGYIAEQQHVNTFNLAATVADSPFHAQVCAPKAGQPYGKNSFDAVIKNADGHIVHQYQFKFGKDAKHTIACIKEGNYNNQTIVVPTEQLEAVQAAFPGKTIVSKIGGTDKVPVSSVPLTHADTKELQASVQENDCAFVLDANWTDLDSRLLAKYVGKRAALAGLQGAALATGFHLAAKIATEEPIECEEVVVTAIKTGADSSIKYATAGAIAVASERGVLKLIPPGTPPGIIANIVCISIENVKILSRVASGDVTCREALDLMGCNTMAMIHGLSFGSYGAYKGLLLLGWIPVIGPTGGGLIGGIIGYMAGSTVGESVYKAAKAVASVAKNTVQKVWDSVKEAGRKIFTASRKVVFN